MTLDELIKQFPAFTIEDGYANPPSILQNANEEGAWVRARRTPSNGIWYMVNDEVNNQLIYPGNIIVVDKFNSFTTKPVEIPFKSEERKKLRFDAKYSNEISDVYKQLVGFTRADVNSFVNACLTNYKKGNHDLASNSRWHYEQSDRKEGITLGGTIKGVDFSGELGSRNKTVTVAYMKQEMYTISLNNEYSSASDIFSDKMDLKKFAENTYKHCRRRGFNKYWYTGAPAIIDAVKYGRIIALWVVQEGNRPASLSIDKLFKLSVGGTNSSTKYHLRVYGGVAGDQNFCISTDNKETIENALKEMKEVSAKAMETALPIEYSIKFLKDLTTNVQWKVLPYYKTYIPTVRVRVTETNPGASIGLYLNALNYRMWGNKLDYVKYESTKCTLDVTFESLSPKAICIDLKFDVKGAADKYDFNVMLPCIPYDTLEPNQDGEWIFRINVYGSTLFDTKKFWCSPNVAGAVISTSNQYWMNRFEDSPMRIYDKAGASEKKILEYYISWWNKMLNANPGAGLGWATPINSVKDLRPSSDY